jgi:hypothetical protein
MEIVETLSILAWVGLRISFTTEKTFFGIKSDQDDIRVKMTYGLAREGKDKDTQDPKGIGAHTDQRFFPDTSVIVIMIIVFFARIQVVCMDSEEKHHQSQEDDKHHRDARSVFQGIKLSEAAQRCHDGETNNDPRLPSHPKSISTKLTHHLRHETTDDD